MQIERKITISWWWRNNDLDEIDPEHAEALDESARERIFKMIKEGYVQGELHDNIHMHDSDPEDGVDYHGWWAEVEEKK